MDRKGWKKRTKSSESDSELNSSKILRLQDDQSKHQEGLNRSVSKIIIEANSALYSDSGEIIQRENTGAESSVSFQVSNVTDDTSSSNTKSSPSGLKTERAEGMATKKTSDSEKLDLF